MRDFCILMWFPALLLQLLIWFGCPSCGAYPLLAHCCPHCIPPSVPTKEPLDLNQLDEVVNNEIDSEDFYLFMDDLDDDFADYCDIDDVVVLVKKCTLSQIVSIVSKPNISIERRKGWRCKVEKLNIDYRDAVDDGTQWIMDALLTMCSFNFLTIDHGCPSLSALSIF
ncbi:hypothetical protein SUGI_0171710 [Cryptomeria japonica]|nr:hypothetical protein SUGI_0171710 [Cryptomeria japonica]